MNNKIKTLLAETPLDYIPADLFFTTEKQYTRPTSPNTPLSHTMKTKISRYNYTGMELRIPYKPISRMISNESSILMDFGIHSIL